MLSLKKLSLAGISLLSSMTAAEAQTAGDEAVYFSDLPIVASVSRLPQRLADAPTAVTVIDRETIKASGARDLADIFRLVPGFHTYPNNTEAARVSYHGLNDGDYAARLQVLVDGRSLYSPLFGDGVNWATLPVAIGDIERIEVVRGTNAVSYGSNAFLGVVNIITVDPATVRGFSVSTSYGNQNVRDYSFRTGGKLGEAGNFRFTFRQQNDDGLNNRADWIDSYFTRLFDLRTDFQLNDHDTLQFSAGSSDGVTELGRTGASAFATPLGLLSENPLRPLRQSASYLQLHWRRALSSDEDVSVRYNYALDKSDDAFIYPLSTKNRNGQSVFFGYFPVNLSGDQGVRHELEVQHRFALGKEARVAWGSSWRQDGVRSATLLTGQGEVQRDVGRVFGNIEWQPAEWLTANLGAAQEADSMAGSRLAPRASLNFHLNRENTLRLGASRAYHTGSIANYRAYTPVIPLGSTRVVQVFAQATPGLPPERLDTLELGYLGDWHDWRASLDVRVFHERVDNRSFRVGFNDRPQTTIPIQTVDMEGVEYQFKWQPFDATRILLNQAFARISSDRLASARAFMGEINEIVLEEYTENSMPRRSTALMLMQRLPYGLEFSTAAYWQGAMKWSSNTSVMKYHRVDARIGYPFRSGPLGGELAFTVQSLNGDHGEYKAAGDGRVDDRVVSRRQWLSLRLDF